MSTTIIKAKNLNMIDLIGVSGGRQSLYTSRPRGLKRLVEINASQLQPKMSLLIRVMKRKE